MMRLTTLSAIAALCLLAGCGIKPAEVDAPPGTHQSTFPRVYPTPQTVTP